jgi:hypothetical protein
MTAALVPVHGNLLDDTNAAVELPTRGTFVIGAADSASLQIRTPGIHDQHCTLEFQGDRWLIVDSAPGVRINGQPVAGITRLFDRDVLALSIELQWEFVSGETRTREMSVVTPPLALRTRRQAEGLRAPTLQRSWRLTAIVATAAVCVALAAWAIWYIEQQRLDTRALLSDQQAIRFDSLLVVAYDHLERGNSLLELHVTDDAALEFARGINTLALSDLRAHPQVRPRIEALESTVAAIYRAQRLAVPDAYAGARTTMSADKLRNAVLSRDQFSHAVDLVSAAFRLKYHVPIVVVGRDHAEHLALYGKGGALDLRSFTMSADQVAYVIAQCRSYGIRVKDFSQDSILQRQVRAAVNAGLSERAGTGLHIHIDRFADRRDRWTISALDQTSRNLSLVTPDNVTSAPSSNGYGSPRSRRSSSM